jgi:hypothetical protein
VTTLHKKHYFNEENGRNSSILKSVWTLKLRSRTSPTIPGNSTKNHKEK